MKQTIFGMLLIAASLFSACHTDDTAPTRIGKVNVPVNGHQLSTFQYDAGSPYVVVFESGLGDGVQPWLDRNLLEQVAGPVSVLGYSRAGYPGSESGPAPRDIPALRQDLEKLLEATFPGKKYLLVGHSYGGLIIRDFALKNPGETAALLFVDPSHESYNKPDQALEDLLVAGFGANTGGGQEASQLIESMQYASKMTDLPDKPTVVLTSMKTGPGSDAADRQKWYDAHQELGVGLSDFTHIKTDRSGHYIQREEPELVIRYVRELLGKMP